LLRNEAWLTANNILLKHVTDYAGLIGLVEAVWRIVMAGTAEVVKSEVHKRAAEIISSSIRWSAAAGAVPLPVLDLVALGTVQAKMISDLSQAYGRPVSAEAARGVVSVLLGTLLPAGVTGAFLGSGFKLVPVMGTVLGMVSMAALGAAASYAIGKVFVRHFEKGGSLESFSAEAVKDELEAEFTRAKDKQSAAVA
jgi:uncharacterized protein (DUF697 family)